MQLEALPRCHATCPPVSLIKLQGVKAYGDHKFVNKAIQGMKQLRPIMCYISELVLVHCTEMVQKS